MRQIVARQMVAGEGEGLSPMGGPPRLVGPAWGERAGVPVTASSEGGDPAAVPFEALEEARARGTEVLVHDLNDVDYDYADRLIAEQLGVTGAL